jgi:hypothetical protein
MNTDLKAITEEVVVANLPHIAESLRKKGAEEAVKPLQEQIEKLTESLAAKEAELKELNAKEAARQEEAEITSMVAEAVKTAELSLDVFTEARKTLVVKTLKATEAAERAAVLEAFIGDYKDLSGKITEGTSVGNAETPVAEGVEKDTEKAPEATRKPVKEGFVDVNDDEALARLFGK